MAIKTLKRKKKFKKRLLAVFIFTLLVAAVVLILINIKITSVTYEGNTHYTDEELNDLIFAQQWSDNPLMLFYKTTIKKEQETIPFIDSYQISFTSWDSLEIIVYEKNVIGYINYMGFNMYFDKDGIIVESSAEVIPDIPQITGLTFDRMVLYEPLPTENEDIFNRILNLTQLLTVYEIKTDKLFYDSSLNVTLYTADIQVMLGNNEDMTEKISELTGMLLQLEGRCGVLNLESYDANAISPAYTFKENVPEETGETNSPDQEESPPAEEMTESETESEEKIE